jgi:hypothetical protein
MNSLYFELIMSKITAYFADNNKCPVDIEAMSDAFNIGGALVQAPTKPDEDMGLVGRDSCPPTYDFVSLMNPNVQWDKDSVIYATPMCTEPQPDPGRE